MPQTLLALAAILCFSYYSLNRHRADQEVDRRTTIAEADLAAVDVARALMTRVERNAFDEEDTDRRGVRTRPSRSTQGPDAHEDTPAAFDDVDDWHLYTGEEAVSVGLGTLQFDTFVTVRYVKDKKPERPSNNNRPTLTKEISVIVLEQVDYETNRRPARTILRRVVTPASTASATPTGP